MLRKCLLLLLMLAMAGCSLAPPAPKVDLLTLRTQAEQLPGASVSPGEPLRIAYPDSSLFAEKAVLPLPGGVQVLDPLAQLLNEYPTTRWQVVTRAATGYGAEHDRQLADKRSELIKRYLTRKGVKTDQYDWAAVTGTEARLELILLRPGR